MNEKEKSGRSANAQLCETRGLRQNTRGVSSAPLVCRSWRCARLYGRNDQDKHKAQSFAEFPTGMVMRVNARRCQPMTAPSLDDCPRSSR